MFYHNKWDMTTFISTKYYADKALRYELDRVFKIVHVDVKTFPNYEILARIEHIDRVDGKIFVFQNLFPNPNQNLILLFQILDILRHYKRLNEIYVIIPYLSYSRQDKRFLQGEALSLKVVLDHISSYEVNGIILFDVHNIKAVLDISKSPIYHFSLLEDIVREAIKLEKIKFDNSILVAPDIGREIVVRKIAKKLNIESITIKKYRDRVTGEVKFDFTSKEDRLDGYNTAIIIDDEISTGGTMAGVAKFLKDMGIKNIYSIATHLLLVNNAEQLLLNSGVKKIMGSDTIENKNSILSIFKIIPDIIKTII